MHATRLVQGCLEPLVGLLDIKRKFPRLIITELFSRSHLIERYQPLNDLATVLKLSISHFVDRLNDFR